MNDSLAYPRTPGMATSPTPVQSRILLISTRRDARRLHKELEQATGQRVRVLGFVDASHHGLRGPRFRGRHLAVDARSQPIPVLGDLGRLGSVIDRTRATDLVIALPGGSRRTRISQLREFSRSDIRVHWVNLDEAGALADLGHRLPSVVSEGPARQEWASSAALLPRLRQAVNWPRLAKRAMDVLGASIGLAILSPLFAVVALAIYLTSGRPIFYSQERVGQGGKRFRIVKFRSMRTDAEHETGPIWASDHDSRCTRIGDLLRHSNIDELPQLFNVLIGQMSLVGPRPERPVFVEQFGESMPDYNLRHAVPSGMTGWAQVHGWRGRTSLRKRIQYDLDYIERWSFWLDIRILFMTFQHVAWGKTSWKLTRPMRTAR